MNAVAELAQRLDAAGVTAEGRGAIFVILSGNYVGPELVAEFGRLPPSMLPNGGQPLYEAQLDMAQALDAEAVIVLPQDFELSAFDRKRFDARGVTFVASDGGSILDSLRAGLAARPATAAYILFGDTLVPNLSSWPDDSFAAGDTDHVAAWAGYAEEAGRSTFHERLPDAAGSGSVVAGFFHFSDLAALQDAAASAVDLTGLLNRYSATRPMTAFREADWLDFGHLFTYHQSRCRELLARSFNSVSSDGHSVVKSGSPSRKIFAEAEWYRKLPAQLRPFAPHFLGEREGEGGEVSYEVEYLYLPLMSELYSFAHLPRSAWATMIESCRQFLEAMQRIRPAAHRVPANYARFFFDDVIAAKTRNRVREFARDRGLRSDQPWVFNGAPFLSLDALAERLIAMIRPTEPEDVTFWHGDFHFANIFYDFRSRKVRVVDPRGLLPNGMLTVYGDARYDVSKLGHSIFGFYDLLIAGRYDLRYDDAYDLSLTFWPDDRYDEVIGIYAGQTMGRYRTFDREAIAMVALLFLSMLPLHAQDPKRQTALLGNAMRLAAMAEDAG